jgi:hypothetical protein
MAATSAAMTWGAMGLPWWLETAWMPAGAGMTGWGMGGLLLMCGTKGVDGRDGRGHDGAAMTGGHGSAMVVGDGGLDFEEDGLGGALGVEG